MAENNKVTIFCLFHTKSFFAQVNAKVKKYNVTQCDGTEEKDRKVQYNSFISQVKAHNPEKGERVRLLIEANYDKPGGGEITELATAAATATKYPVFFYSGADITNFGVFSKIPRLNKISPLPEQNQGNVWYIPKNDLMVRIDHFLFFDFAGDTTRDFNSRDLEESRDIESSRDVSEGKDQVRNVLNVYTQIATNPDLQKLRQQERGLFDTLLQHAVPFALNAAQTAVSLIGRNRDLGSNDIAVQRHLPTALNLAHQIQSLPEVQADRGLFDKIFSIGMPLVLNAAQTLLGAKRGLGTADDDAQRGFFSSIIGNLPGTVFNVLSNVLAKRDLGDENRDFAEGDRGFFDILKKIAPIVLNVAGSAVQSLQGQRSLAFAPTDRGFFDKIKNFVTKVINNPMVKKIGGMALNMGVGMVQNLISEKRAIGEPIPSTEQTEAHVRGFFGSMLQTLAPIAMGALQGAVSSIGKRDIDGGRGVAIVSHERGIFDIVAQYLPTVIQIAQQNFAKKRALGGVTEDESQYLNRVINTVATPLIVSAQRQISNPTEEGERGILGSLIGGLLPF